MKETLVQVILYANWSDWYFVFIPFFKIATLESRPYSLMKDEESEVQGK